MKITKSQLQQVIRESIQEEYESGAARAYASDLYAILEKGVKGPSYDGPVGSGPSADMEDYESDYRDPPSKPLDMSGGRKVSKAQRRREAEMMKDYDI